MVTAHDTISQDYAFAENGGTIVYLRSGEAMGHSAVIVALELVSGAKRESGWSESRVTALTADPHTNRVFAALSSHPPQTFIVPLWVTDLTQDSAIGEIQDDVRRLCVSANGRWLAAQSLYHLRAWNLGKPKPPKRGSLRVDTKGWANDFALAADGSRLAAAHSSGLYVWNTFTKERSFFSGKHKRSVTAVACSPTKPLIASGDNAGRVFLWDFSGNVLTRYDWKLGEVCCLAFAPDGLRCAAADATGKVVVWDVDV